MEMLDVDIQKLIEKLEQYRESNDLTKADMSRLLGCNSLQQYNNWTYRRSLPKRYIPRAYAILNMDKEVARTTLDIFEIVVRMPDEQQKKLLALLEDFGPAQK